MSNKAEIPQKIPVGASLNDYKKAGAYYGDSAGISDLPPNPMNETAFALNIQKTAKDKDRVIQVLSWYYTGTIYYRTWNGTVWSESWTQLAIVTPPKEYSFPMAEGVTSYSLRYWKDGAGNVGISSTFSFDSPPGAFQLIGTLPEGYRPLTRQTVILQSALNTSTYGWIETDGRVRLSDIDHSGQFSPGVPIAILVSPFFPAN